VRHFPSERRFLQLKVSDGFVHPLSKILPQGDPPLLGQDDCFPDTYRRKPQLVIRAGEFPIDFRSDLPGFQIIPDPDVRIEKQIHF
jgi:hypothetical protein